MSKTEVCLEALKIDSAVFAAIFQRVQRVKQVFQRLQCTQVRERRQDSDRFALNLYRDSFALKPEEVCYLSELFAIQTDDTFFTRRSYWNLLLEDGIMHGSPARSSLRRQPEFHTELYHQDIARPKEHTGRAGHLGKNCQFGQSASLFDKLEYRIHDKRVNQVRQCARPRATWIVGGDPHKHRREAEMYKRILAPLDGSGMAEQALPYVRFLAKDLQAKVELLRITGGVPLEILNNQELHPQDILDALRTEANDYLNETRKRLDNIGLAVSLSVRDGSPAQEIVEAAEQEPDTIIAMTTHGRSGMARWVMGSVADKALHATDCPFLLIKAKEETAIESEAKVNRIIVPLDGSEFAEEALEHAAALAGPRRLKVILARVTPSLGEYRRYMQYTMIDASTSVYTGPYEEWSRETDADAMSYLRDVGERFAAQNGVTVEEKLLKGSPADAIVGLVREEPDSLVVMTSHGRSGVGRWLLGSVADRIVRYSGGPTLVIRPKAVGDSAQ